MRTLYCTLFLTAVLIAAHGFYRMVPLLMTIYLTWSPWHYMGQNFGLMLMFGHRNELKIDHRGRNTLWIAFVASYLLTFLSFHTGPSTPSNPFWISIGFPPSLLDTLRIPLMVVFFAGALPLARLIRQAGAKRKRDSAQPQQWKPMLAPVTLYLTQFLWAVLPSALVFLRGFGVPQVAYSVSMLAVMHCAQYLWITNYYARREAKAESTGWHWRRYFAILVIGGVALFIAGPWLVLRRTLNRCSGTFRRQIPTGRTADSSRSRRIGFRAEALGNQGDDHRRSLPTILIVSQLRRYQASFPSLRGEREWKAHFARPSHPPGTMKTWSLE